MEPLPTSCYAGDWIHATKHRPLYMCNTPSGSSIITVHIDDMATATSSRQKWPNSKNNLGSSSASWTLVSLSGCWVLLLLVIITHAPYLYLKLHTLRAWPNACALRTHSLWLCFWIHMSCSWKTFDPPVGRTNYRWRKSHTSLKLDPQCTLQLPHIPTSHMPYNISVSSTEIQAMQIGLLHRTSSGTYKIIGAWQTQN